MVCKYSCTDRYIVSDNAGFCGMYSILKQPNLMVLAVGRAGGQAGQTGRHFFPQAVHGREDGSAISGWHGARQDRQCTGSSHDGLSGA